MKHSSSVHAQSPFYRKTDEYFLSGRLHIAGGGSNRGLGRRESIYTRHVCAPSELSRYLIAEAHQSNRCAVIRVNARLRLKLR